MTKQIQSRGRYGPQANDVDQSHGFQKVATTRKNQVQGAWLKLAIEYTHKRPCNWREQEVFKIRSNFLSQEFAIDARSIFCSCGRICVQATESPVVGISPCSGTVAFLACGLELVVKGRKKLVGSLLTSILCPPPQRRQDRLSPRCKHACLESPDSLISVVQSQIIAI